jgi:acetyl esterase/lipase
MTLSLRCSRRSRAAPSRPTWAPWHRLQPPTAKPAMRLVRSRAAEWSVDPTQVGFTGFSVGGNVAMRVPATSDEDARPSFLAPIYAAVAELDLSTPPPGSGPMFIAAASDDQLGLAGDSIKLYECWHTAELPVELHLYERGGHGFGMRDQSLPTDSWIERFGDWLASHGQAGTT